MYPLCMLQVSYTCDMCPTSIPSSAILTNSLVAHKGFAEFPVQWLFYHLFLSFQLGVLFAFGFSFDNFFNSSLQKKKKHL